MDYAGKTIRLWAAKSAAALVMVSMLCTSAMAGIIYPEDTVLLRQRSVDDKDPNGMRLGAFTLKPVMELREVYDDNIFRRGDNTVSDYISYVRPGAELQSNWLRHGIFLGAMGDFAYYKDRDDQDYKDYSVLASGQYDIAPDTYIIAGINDGKRHQSRNPDDIASADDDSLGSYDFTTKTIGFTRALSKLRFKITGQETDTKISDDTDTFIFGSEDFVERNSKSLTTTISYAYMPGNEVFVTNILDKSEYDLPGNVSGDSDGVNWRAGLNFDSNSLWSGSVFAGHLSREYSDATDDTDEPYFGGSLVYSVTRLTQVSLTLDKTFTDTTSVTSAGNIRTTRRLDMRSSITPLITGRATLGYDNIEYVGGTSDGRNADLLYTGVGADYAVTDNVALRVGYDYRERESNRANDDFTNNRVLFSLVYNP